MLHLDHHSTLHAPRSTLFETCGPTGFRCFKTEAGAIIEGSRYRGHPVDAILCPFCNKYHWLAKPSPKTLKK